MLKNLGFPLLGMMLLLTAVASAQVLPGDGGCLPCGQLNMCEGAGASRACETTKQFFACSGSGNTCSHEGCCN